MIHRWKSNVPYLCMLKIRKWCVPHIHIHTQSKVGKEYGQNFSNLQIGKEAKKKKELCESFKYL